MKNNRTLAVAVMIGAILGIAGGPACVSVNIGQDQASRSSGVTFDGPEAGFEKIDNSRADQAWKNKTTGSTIAYQSSCGETADVPLESIAEEIFFGFEEKIVIRDQRKPFDGREALDAEREGKIDGVATRIRAIAYKKNTCTYVLTFIGLPKHFAADSTQFVRFVDSFKAP